MSERDGVNWDAASHQQLWEWFSQPQLGEMQGWMNSLTDKVAVHFQAAADKVDQALRAAGVHWEGAAAGAMQAATTPLAEHALRAKDAATQAGATTLAQFMHAKNIAMALPEPQPVPDQSIPLTASPGELFLHLKDVHEKEAAANEAESRARDLARSYDTAADDAVGALPRFESAPVATVSRAEPADVIVVDEPRPGGGTDPRRDAGPGDPGRPPGGPSGPLTGTNPPPPGGQPSDTTSGQSWTPPASDPVGGRPVGPGLPGETTGSTPRPTAPLVAPGPFGSGGQNPAVPRGGTPGAGGQPPGGRSGQVPAGPGSGVRGGPVGEGPVAARAGTATTAGRGAGGGMGMAPMGAGRGRDDEDVEHSSPEYLRDYHDEFWDDTPPVAPPVIGDEDDE